VQVSVREIETLHQKTDAVEKVLLTPGVPFSHPVNSDSLHLLVELKMGYADEIEFDVRGAKITCSLKDRQFRIGENKIDFPAAHDRIQWEILLDRTSLELFADDGRTSAAFCFAPDDTNREISFAVNGAAAELVHLHIDELCPTW
jgi:sucrose-6-phosphate hydrolase SacC (GH32 family)